jgi:hypothetical protein
MRISSAGNVGIGTSSPFTGSKLTVAVDTTGATVPTDNLVAIVDSKDMALGDGGGIRFGGVFTTGGSTNPDMTYIKAYKENATSGNYSYALTFGTRANGGNPQEQMRIDSSGNILIGQTTVSNAVNGLYFQATGGGSANIVHATGIASGTGYAYFLYAGAVIGSITQSGTTAVLYNVTSDQRLKTNIVDAPSGNIDDIKVRSFDWIADNSHQTYGMVAQELLEVAPYAVHQPQDTEEMMAVDYSKLVPMMIREIQDLKQRIATLEK